jgi:predicted ATPase/DNA-binding CsgD family transcriptional regulator
MAPARVDVGHRRGEVRVRLSPGTSPPPRPLPEPLSRLVGRAGELDRLGLLLGDPGCRLLTLTGPPGVGKTSLAVAAARAAEAGFADGVVFVDLTAVRDPALVPAEIAASLGTGAVDADRLAASLADVHLLLVLDNVEHLLPAAASIAALLAASPRLNVLATSRERLHLRLEREVPVTPLALPGQAELADLGRLAATPSVELLVQQVRAFQPDFAVTPANRAALAEICVRLDGLPLALELAAPRLRLYNPGELLFRLRHRVGSLASDARDVPDRHRTLHSALAWSHDLLGPREREMFRQLSVFSGGWTLQAAEQVCGDPDGLDVLASLVDKSLVRRHDELPSGTARFGMLESLREFAADLLERAGGTEAAQEAHAQYFTGLAAAIDAGIGTVEERWSIEEVGLDVGNLRAALAHCLATGRTADALPLASALGWYAWTRGQLGTGQATVEAAITAAADLADPPEDALAGALFMAGAIALARGDLDGAEGRLRPSLAISERIGSRRRTAVGTAFLGHLARARGRNDDAVRLHELAGRLHGELANTPGVAWSRYDLGLMARRRRDPQGAAPPLREALDAFRGLEYVWAMGCCAWALATVELSRGLLPEAAGLLSEALDAFETAEDGRGIAQCLEAVAAVACESSAFRASARLLGGAAALRERLAAPLPEEERDAHQTVVRRVQQALGEVVADRLERDGTALSTAAVVATARDVLGGATPVPLPGGALTPREREVALLVRQGRTNRQIGRALGMAERTAEVHVHHIIRKLGAGSRAEIAAWVAAQAADP